MPAAWQFVEPQLRTVVQLFRQMTVEQQGHLRDHNHLLYFALEDLEQMVAITDESRQAIERQRDDAVRALAEMDG